MKRVLSLFLVTMTVTLLSGKFVHAQAPLPPFKFQSVMGGDLTPEKLAKDKPVIVFFYDPTCDHCQQEARWVGEMINDFKDINLVWVTWGEWQDVKTFIQTHFTHDGKPIMPSSTIHFAKDTGYTFDSFFGDSPIPSVHIYSKEWTHVKTFKNEVHAVELLKVLEE